MENYKINMFRNIRKQYMLNVRMSMSYEEKQKMSNKELIEFLSDSFTKKFNEIFEKYSFEIITSLVNIEGMSQEEAKKCLDTYSIISDFEKKESKALDTFIDILNRNNEIVEDDDEITQILHKTKTNIQMQITKSIMSREILNKKLGIPLNYRFEGKIGDNGIYNSKEFNLDFVRLLEDVDITEQEFETIYNMYSLDISEVIGRNSALKVYSLDNSIVYNPEITMKAGFEFMSGKVELTSESKIAVQEMILLLKTYGKDKLLSKDEKVKKELKSGLYDYIKATKELITPNQREKLYQLADVWNKNDFANYTNLELLKQRYEYILKKRQCKDISKVKELIIKVNSIINSEIPNIQETIEIDGEPVLKAVELSNSMKLIYNDFEKYNREDIIASIYNPNNDQTIEKEEDVPNNMLVHFYNPSENIRTLFETVLINRAKTKLGEQPIKMFSEHFKDEYIIERKRFEKEILESEIDNYINELLPGESFEILEGDQGHRRLDAIKSSGKQLATFLASKKNIIEILEKNQRLACGPVAYAVGFSKDTISEDHIILTCNENANSNISKENIPCDDTFISLSHTYDELINSPSQRTEVLLSRKFEDKKIEAGYFLCVYDKKKLEEPRNEYSKDEMLQQINIAKNLNLKCILVDIEQIKINEKEEINNDINSR